MAEEVKENKSGRAILVVLSIVIILLLVVMVVGGYFLYSNSNLNSNPMSKDDTAQVDVSDAKESFKVPINDLVLNITNSKGREKLMKLSFSLKSTEVTIAQIVDDNKAEIIDVVISQISARSSEELLTVGGKELLKEELIEEINIVLNDATAGNSDVKKNSIKNLYFTTFVIK